MNAHKSAPFRTLARLAIAAVLTAMAAAPTIGCDSAQEPDHNLRADLAALRTSHGDPEAIGSLDATAPPPDLNDYRRPAYRTVAAH